MSDKLSPVSVAVALLTVVATAAYKYSSRFWQQRPKERSSSSTRSSGSPTESSSSPTDNSSSSSVISTIIATALAHFLVIDAETIESHIIRGKSEIVLHNLQLRPQVQPFRNSVGQISGLIREAMFTWKWGEWKDEAWIINVALVVRGLKVKVELLPAEEETFFDAHSILPPLLETVEEKAAALPPHLEKEIRSKGGLQVYIENQVQLILDSLSVNVEGFDVIIHLPVTQQYCGQSKASIAIGGESINLTSFRQQQHDHAVKQTNNADESSLKLCVSIGSVCMSVLKDSEPAPLPILQPFNYSVDATRTGQRWDIGGEWRCGRADDDDAEDDCNSGLVVHAGSLQIRALTQLRNLLFQLPLLPGDRCGDIETTRSSTVECDLTGGDDGGTPRTGDDDTSSTFEFDLPSVSLIWMDNIKVRVGELIISYRGGDLFSH